MYKNCIKIKKKKEKKKETGQEGVGMLSNLPKFTVRAST